jgi:hypothetical protein
MKVEYQQPWQLFIIKDDTVNPILGFSNITTITFNIDEEYKKDYKIGILGTPGKNFGLSYDFEVKSFVFEFWTKEYKEEKFHCYKDFNINLETNKSLTFTIEYNKEEKYFKLYHNFVEFFKVDFDGILIEEYLKEPLWFGTHNPHTDNERHNCFCEIDITHFSILSGNANINDMVNFYNDEQNNENVLCYFDLENEQILYKKNYIFNVLKNNINLLPRLTFEDLNDNLKFVENHKLKVDYKKPLELKIVDDKSINPILLESSITTISFKILNNFKKDDVAGIIGVPGKNFGLGYDYINDCLTFEYWTIDYEKLEENHTYKIYDIKQKNLVNGIVITLRYNQDNKSFEIFNNFESIFFTKYKDTLLKDYLNQSLWIGAHNPDVINSNHNNFTEMEIYHFSILSKNANIEDMVNFYNDEQNNENVLCYLDIKNNLLVYNGIKKYNLLENELNKLPRVSMSDIKKKDNVVEGHNVIIDYGEPWKLENVDFYNEYNKNPFLNETNTLTIGFKIDNNFKRDNKIGIIGVPGKNFGISYDYQLDSFMFEYWTKINNSEIFYSHTDFKISDTDLNEGIILTIVYNKEKKNFTIFQNFIEIFNINFQGNLLEEYNTQPLYFGCHNPDAKVALHRCLTQLKITHFSIFNGEMLIEDIKNFYLQHKNDYKNLSCYFDLKNKYFINGDLKNYKLIQGESIKLSKRKLSTILKRNSKLKIEYDKPWQLKLNKLVNNYNFTSLFDGDFSILIKFVIGKKYTKDKKMGIFGIPGKNFGISYDTTVDAFVFEYWTKEKNGEDKLNYHLDFDITQTTLDKGLVISMVYTKEKNNFKLYRGLELFMDITVDKPLIDEYKTQPLYFGCHNPRATELEHRCLTEIELSNFSIFNSVMDVSDIYNFLINKKETENLICNFDFANVNGTLCYDETGNFNLFQGIGLPMTDFDSTKEKLNSVGCGFCLAKWTQVTMHLHNGTTHSCHHPEPHKVGLEEVERNYTALHNSNTKKQARKQMLEGERPKECQYCWNVEDSSDSFSDRIFKSAEPWSEPYFDEIKDSHWRSDYNPKYSEVSFSNTCNFKCAYCGPEYSSKWVEEINQYGEYVLESQTFNGLDPMIVKKTLPYKHSEFNPYVEAFWKWWPELYHSLDTFRITGGEPLLSKDTWGVLDYIIESENPNRELKLSINSNLGVPDDLVDKLIQKLEIIINEKRVKEVIIFTSCDAYGKQAEYVRYGLEFNRLISNIDKILLLLPKVTIVIMSTFNMFSIFSYEKLIRKVYELKLKHFNTERYWNSSLILDTSYLRFPDFLSFRILKGYLNVEYFERCEKYMKFNSTYRSLNFYEQQVIEDVGFSTKEIEKITRIKEMFLTDAEINEDLFYKQKKDFLKFIKEYEVRRGLKCEEYYPELIEFIKNIEYEN